MTKTLYVPQHVIKKKQEEKSAVKRLPQPTGWRILVLPFEIKKKTASGLHLPDSVIERENIATTCGKVLKVGPLAYRDYDKFLGHAWCQEGDWVIFSRYAGSRFKIQGGECRILNDDEILATIDNPEDILHT
jgi:chaperonin GroES